MFKKPSGCYHRIEFGKCGTTAPCYCEQYYHSLPARIDRMLDFVKNLF